MRIRMERKLRLKFTASFIAVYCVPSANTTHALLKGAISHLCNLNPTREGGCIKKARKGTRCPMRFLDMCRETLSSYYLRSVKRGTVWREEEGGGNAQYCKAESRNVSLQNKCRMAGNCNPGISSMPPPTHIIYHQCWETQFLCLFICNTYHTNYYKAHIVN